MSRRTIFAYLPEKDRVEQVLSVAAILARRDRSHLIGAYVIPPIAVYPMMTELPQAVYDGHLAMYQKDAEEMKARFDELTEGDQFVSEWRTLDSGAAPVAHALMEHVRCADLIIAPHYNADYSEHPYEGVAETLAMESGRPVLMLPQHMRTDAVGEHITVAWDGSRESVRAVFDALDLLREAKTVRILSVGEAPRRGSNAMLPGAEIAATLARRGVNCEVDHVVKGSLSVGDAILARIGDMGSDLLVMGIYGHSKLREFVFGGATRSIVKHMTVPVLMSR